MITEYHTLNRSQLAFLDAAIIAEKAFIRAERALNLPFDDPKRSAVKHESRAMRKEFVALIGHGICTTDIHRLAMRQLECESE